MSTETQLQEHMGVDTHSLGTLDPRQQKFKELYFDPASQTFANCYKSAISAGYSHQTARNITHNRPAWYSEMLGELQSLEPEHLVIKLTQIMNNPSESTQNVLKAIDMLMKCRGMYKETSSVIALKTINIQDVLD